MTDVRLPEGAQVVPLAREHPRKAFRSGQPLVDDWLGTKALQQQEKHLSATKVLLDSAGHILGYYTIAPGQVDYAGLPPELVKRLPKRPLPVAVLAWLGIDERHAGQGLGSRLLAHALRHCYDASKVFPFVAVIIDCLDDDSKHFFEKFDFDEVPGNPYRLFLSIQRLEASMESRED